MSRKFEEIKRTGPGVDNKEHEFQQKIIADGPLGDDEKHVTIFYYADAVEALKIPIPWDELEEWQRASWRIEYRNQ